MTKQSSENEAIANSELEAIVANQVFVNSTLLKYDFKSWIKDADLNLKLKISHSWYRGL